MTLFPHFKLIWPTNGLIIYLYFRYVSPTSLFPSSTGSGTSKETINPIYDSEENTVRQAHDNEAIEMYNTTSDNVLYEPANELFEGNPIYQGTDYDNDETYAEPNE